MPKTPQNSSGPSPAIITFKQVLSAAILSSIMDLSGFGRSVLPVPANRPNGDSARAQYLTKRLVSLANKSGLSAGLQTTIEQRVQITGELEILYEDAWPKSSLRYFLKANGKRHSLHFTAEPPTQFKTGDQVTVQGLQLGSELAVNSITSAAATSSGPLMVTNSSFGEQKVLVILVNFQDKQTQPITPDQTRSVMTTTSNYYREGSYGQMWLTSDVFGWFTIPVSSTTCDRAAIASAAQQAAVAAGANLSGYTHYVYAFPANACAWSGLGTVGGNPSEAWLNGWFDLQEFGHELGHNFGLFHSRSMDCGAAVTGSNCTIAEYGDGLDVMGSASSAHFNLFQKERLGWANYGSSPSISTVATSGNYWIDSYEGMSTNPKGLKILKSTDPSTGARTWYYLEHRSAYGFDGFLAGNANVMNGAVVHQGSEASGQSIYLLDLTPATASWMDPALTTGQSFTDPDAGVTITVLSSDSTGAMVGVSFGPQQCIAANPTVTLSPSQGPVVAAGTAVSYSVTLSNNDSANCGAATFNLQSSIPAGWTASFALASLNINAGASATTTLQVTSASAAAGGTYNIGVTAGNSSQPVYSGTASATYAVTLPPSPPSIAVSSNQASYSRNQTATITAIVSANGSPVMGATVAFTMTKSNGSVVKGSGVTGSNGGATFQYSLNRKKDDPAGTYQVVGTTSVNGIAISGTTSFLAR
jgi:hypothetical protein